MPTDPLFESMELPGGLLLQNRLAMAPMTTYSAYSDGRISERELAYYRTRADGPGLILTGCTPVAHSGVGFIEEFAGYEDRFLPSLMALAEAARSGGRPAVLQVFHAGDKALPQRVPGGEVVSSSAHLAPRSQQAAGGGSVRAMTETEIQDMVLAFGETARRAVVAGFDGVELHGAHGFLLQNFLSPAVNLRKDYWGGSAEARARFPRAVAREVRRVVQDHAQRPFVIGYRVSLEESSAENGLRAPETLQLVDWLIEDGSVDYVHGSFGLALADTGADDPDRTLVSRLVEAVHGRVPVLGAGGFTDPEEARRGLEEGLDVVALGRGLVMEPRWVQLAREGQDRQIRRAFDVQAPAEDTEVPPGLHRMIETSPGWFPLRAQ